jgi:hypothetical protein
LVHDLVVSTSFCGGSSCYATTARDSSVMNTLPVLCYWSTHEWIDADRKNGGPEENDDGEITSARYRRRRPLKMQSAEDWRSVRRASMSSIRRWRRPEETRRGAPCRFGSRVDPR